ncbi:flagellar basal body L-ring protein FlgH [Cypionkella sp.]|jgi:flagellar L-ring protein FlgH|uniref:flagellar basal body L-ring protein FlgH n=1 Tax=Cypionkella sp. TaxID=2811411 RepID=UPI002FDEADB7
MTANVAAKIGLCLLALSACSEVIEEKASVDYQPVYTLPEAMDPMAMPTGGIYSSAQVGLFATDRRAGRVGDILTVAFTESFSATKSQNAAAAKSSNANLAVPLLGSTLGTKLATGTDQNFTGSGSAAQSNSLTGQVSVHVIRVLPGGNLEILGQKRLTLNNGDEYIRVKGIVRPEDISSDNVVQSDRIADADIKYVGAGELADTGKQGWLGRALTSVNPF